MTTAIANPVATEAACPGWGLGALPDDRRYELIDGKPVELPPMRFTQAVVANQMSYLFAQYVQSEGLPYLTGVDASFRLGLPQGNSRIPDVSVTAVRRILGSLDDEPSAWEGIPDIAVEVISPSDAYVDVIGKANLYLSQGVATVLLVDLYHREVTVRQASGEIRVLTADDTLTGEPTLPGFSCRVDDIFSNLNLLLTSETDGN